MITALLNLQAGAKPGPVGSMPGLLGNQVVLVNGPILWSPDGGGLGGVQLRRLDAGAAAKEITDTSD
jgi:hypothetical protein